MKTILMGFKERDHSLELGIFLVGVIILITRVFLLNHHNIVLDDAFISFRYAQNLSNGLGLVFNAGEKVEGYTNFLWTILLAFSIKIGFDVIKSSMVLAFISTIGTMYLILLMVRRALYPKGERVVALAAAIFLFAIMGSQARFIVSGMETLLFVFLITLAIYSYLFTSKPLITGLLFGLLALCRPEGIIYFGFVVGFALLTENNKKYILSRLLLGFLIIYVPYFIWRYSFYGFLFPNTYYAKASGFSMQRLARGFSELKWILDEWFYWPILILCLCSIPVTWRSRPTRLYWVLSLVTFAYFVYVGGDFVIWFGPRFLMPTLPLNILLAVDGLLYITNWIPSSRYRKSALRVSGVALLMIVFLGYSWPTITDDLSPFSNEMQAWKELGLWMKSQFPVSTTIATDAAGIIPFYTNFYTLDMYGLTDEHIAHLPIQTGVGVIAHEKFDPTYIFSKKPDCIVSTWISENGKPLAAGLPELEDKISKKYSLIAVSKSGFSMSPEDPWVIITSTYSGNLFERGYLTGLFCRDDYLKEIEFTQASNLEK